MTSNNGRSDRITVSWEPATGTPHRLRFEPRHDGRWSRVEQEWNGCVWRTVGHEIVDSIGFENVPPECREVAP